MLFVLLLNQSSAYESMCVEWAAHGQPTVMFLELLKTVPVGLN